MTTPPKTPDCILSLKDGSMLACSSSIIIDWLEKDKQVQHSYHLPIYHIDEEPDAVQLLHRICDGQADAEREPIPPLSALYALTQLCAKTDRMSVCVQHVRMWLYRWMTSFWDEITADVLQIALHCRDPRMIVKTYRVLLLAALPDNEIRRVEEMTRDLPVPRKSNNNESKCSRLTGRCSPHSRAAFSTPETSTRVSFAARQRPSRDVSLRGNVRRNTLLPDTGCRCYGLSSRPTKCRSLPTRWG